MYVQYVLLSYHREVEGEMEGSKFCPLIFNSHVMYVCMFCIHEEVVISDFQCFTSMLQLCVCMFMNEFLSRCKH